MGLLEPGLADFILMTERRFLPPAGTFGAMLEGGVAAPTVSECLPNSACQQAGLKRGDRFYSIDEQPVEDMSDLRLMIWDKKPGDTVAVGIRRPRWFSSPEELAYTVRLR